jgi:hypothetical protein
MPTAMAIAQLPANDTVGWSGPTNFTTTLEIHNQATDFVNEVMPTQGATSRTFRR